jgi:hypothetical protein
VMLQLWTYSGSKNCPNVWPFWKDWLAINQINYVIIRKYYISWFSILAFGNVWKHVIWIKTDVVMSRIKHCIIGTVFWPSIIFIISPFY